MKPNIIVIMMSLMTYQASAFNKTANYPIVDTGQIHCYSNYQRISCKELKGSPYSGQDAEHQGLQPSYSDNNDGTITDENTGLMWQQQVSAKVDWKTAVDQAHRLRLIPADFHREEGRRGMLSVFIIMFAV